MRAVLPSSHEWPASFIANESGRKTERIPWVSHFSGKTAAISCIHLGRSEKTKKTPERNCSTITIGETTADAPRPLLGTDENAIPSTVEQALPRMMSQIKRNQSVADVGRCKPKRSAPKPSRSATWKSIAAVTTIALPMK